MKLHSEEAEIHQFIEQSGMYMSLCIQPKPPWLYMQTKLGTKVEEGGVYPRGKAKTDVQLILSKLLLRRPYSKLSIEICLSDVQVTRSGTEDGLHSFCESNKPLMQAFGIPHGNEKMQFCVVDWELLTLQTHGHGWIYQGFVMLNRLHPNLLSTQGADEDDIITRKHHRVLV